MSTYRKQLDVYNAPRVSFDHRISHVCHRWRAIALLCADLWSVVPYPEGPPKRTKLCLSRSIHSPIEFFVPLEMSWTESAAQDAIRLVLPHLARVRRLDVHLGLDGYYLRPNEQEVSSSLTRDILEGLTAQPMPWLEDVALVLHTSAIDVDRPFRGPTFPSSLFKRQPVPRLRRLKLAYCVVPLASPVYAPSLRHLELHNVRGWGNIDGMIQCLQNTPLLETFIFKDTGGYLEQLPSDARRSLGHSRRCVRLDHLSRLELAGMFVFTAAIFSHISIPSSATIHISRPGKRSGPDTGHFTMFTKALTDHYVSSFTDGARFQRVVVDEVNIMADPEYHSNDGTIACKNVVGRFNLGIHKTYLYDPNVAEFIRTVLSIPIFRDSQSIEYTAKFRQMYPALNTDWEFYNPYLMSTEDVAG